MKYKIIIYLSILAIIGACKPEIEEFTFSSGDADFTTFVSIGNSTTAGYTDGALYKSAQEASLPNIIASQLKYVGLKGFSQPLIGTENGVGLATTPMGPYFYTKRILKLVPEIDCTGQPTGGILLEPVLAVENADQLQLQQELFAPPVVTPPYHNISVPGSTIKHMLYSGYGNPINLIMGLANPYYVRFASSADASMVQDALGTNPSFILMWSGNNDVLTSASMGTVDFVTPKDTFDLYYKFVAQTLFDPANVNRKGVLLNIPDITDIPYFTTISQQLPFNALLLPADTAALMTFVYQLAGITNISFSEGPNPFVVWKPDGTIGQMEEGDLFLLNLPTDSIKCFGMGAVNILDTTPYPIPHKYILDIGEQATIRDHILSYNMTIREVAESFDLALVDAHQIMHGFDPGMVFDGIGFNLSYIQGGLFSLDGVHLNPQGSAVLANYVIDAVNKKYNASIPHAEITEYPSIIFP